MRKEFEFYTTSLNTMRLKYDWLPGANYFCVSKFIAENLAYFQMINFLHFVIFLSFKSKLRSFTLMESDIVLSTGVI